LERRLRTGRPWFGNDVEIGRQPIVQIDEKEGEVIVVEIRNGTKAPMKFSEDDVHLKAMVGDDLFRCLSQGISESNIGVKLNRAKKALSVLMNGESDGT
jgi:hypothetical protein